MLLAWGLGFGALAAATSRQRARSPLLWFGYGAILGPIATLILRGAPPGHCPTCLEPSRGWLFVCGRCRSDLRPATVSEAARADQNQPGPDGQPPGAGMAAVTSGGTAVPATSREAGPAVDRADDTVLVAFGVYVGGTAPLVLGSRYGLVVRGKGFEVLGPVDSAPERVVLSRGLDTIDATVVGGRLVVTGLGSERARLALAFDRLSGVTDEALEAALTRGSTAAVRAEDRP